MGGIASADDAIEMILAGATAVSIGTANFNDPKVSEKVAFGIEDYMKKYNVADIRELIGAVHE
jgi:dihydroorotate dehydrogenase (NAD+) catalytic subunit